MALKLLIIEEDKEHILELSTKAKSIGRSSRANLILTDPMVSGLHLEFLINDSGQVFLRDMDSKNASYLNGAVVTESIIGIADIIQIGKTKISLIEKEMNDQEKKIHQKV